MSRKLVQEGLTDLGRTGDGSRVTYLTLTLAVSSHNINVAWMYFVKILFFYLFVELKSSLMAKPGAFLAN